MSFFGGGSSQPATPSSQTQFVREAPGIEERKIELMDIARQVAQEPINLPDYQVAGLGALEQTRDTSKPGNDRCRRWCNGWTRNNWSSTQEQHGACRCSSQISQYLNPYQSICNR